MGGQAAILFSTEERKMTCHRSATWKLSNDDEYIVDFPYELTPIDYLRRILNFTGGSFLIAHNQAIELIKSDLALDSALAFAEAEYQSPAEEEQHHTDLSRPASPKGTHELTLTPQAFKKMLGKILDEPAVRFDPKMLSGFSPKKADKREKKELKRQRVHKEKQVQLLDSWSMVISREPTWVAERSLWLRELKKMIDSCEMVYAPITNDYVKQMFQISIDTLVVLAEAVEHCRWYLSNVQQLRVQFVSHIKHRRERIHKEELEDQKTRGGSGIDDGSSEEPSTGDDGSLVFQYAYDFDQRGIIYWFGTGAGEDKEDSKWENPAVGGKLRAFRSSDGAGMASDICGRERGKYSCTDYREPRQYYGIDLGPYYRVYPTAYTLRHGSSQGILALRDFTVEGSLDGKKWFPIRKHRGDEELPRLAYSTHTWKIEKSMQRKCRIIRVIQTRPVDVAQRLTDVSGGGKKNNDDGHHKKHPQHHALFLSGMEIYGKLAEC